MSVARILIASALTVSFAGLSLATMVQAQTNPLRWKVDEVPIKRSETNNDAPVVTAISVHPHEAKCAFVGDDHLVRIYDTDRRKVVSLLDGHTDWVRGVQYDHAGKQIYSAGNDRKILVWSKGADGTYRHSTFAHENRATTAISISRDNKYIATVGFDNKLNVYDIKSHMRIFQFTCPSADMRAIAFSPTENILAAAGRNGSIRLWHMQSGQTIRDFKPHKMRIRGLSFTKDGENIISCSEDRTVAITKINKVIDATRQSSRQQYKLMSLAVIDHERVAIGDTNNSITIWNFTDLSRDGKLGGHSGTVSALDSAQGFMVSGSYDTSIRVWNWNPSIADQSTKRQAELARAK